MNKIDDYEITKDQHEKMLDIIRETKPKVICGRTSSGDILVVFNFPKLHQDGTVQHRTQQRLADMLSKTCGLKLEEIIESAVKFSFDDLEKKMQAAQDEAINFIKSVGAQESQKEEREEENANETKQNHVGEFQGD